MRSFAVRFSQIVVSGGFFQIHCPLFSSAMIPPAKARSAIQPTSGGAQHQGASPSVGYFRSRCSHFFHIGSSLHSVTGRSRVSRRLGPWRNWPSSALQASPQPLTLMLFSTGKTAAGLACRTAELVMPRTRAPPKPPSSARSRAVAAHVGRVRGRAVRAIHAGTAAVVMSVRAFLERERLHRHAILRDRPAERTSEATGLSLRSVSRMADDVHHAGLPPDGTLERRDVPKRVPAEELVRVREAVCAQYHSRTLPTLDSTPQHLSALDEVVGVQGGAVGDAIGGGGEGGGVSGSAPSAAGSAGGGVCRSAGGAQEGE